MRTNGSRPPRANGTGPNLAPSVSVEVTVPELEPGGWTQLLVDYPTGLAQIGGRVQVAFPKSCGLGLCDAVVVRPNTIRFGVSNLGKTIAPEQTFAIQFHPAVLRRPVVPGITFDLDEVEI